MSLSALLGKSIEDYKEHSREYIDKFLEGCINCVVCGCSMGYHGHYNRGVKDGGEVVCIHRLACKDRECRHTEAVLPDFLLPHKQYSAKEIEAVLLDAEEIVAEKIDTEASESTVRRWVQQMGNMIRCWIIILMQIIRDEEYTKALSHDFSLMEHLTQIINELPPVGKHTNILGAALIHISSST